MVAASPCALAVAPLAYATAISSLASKVLFKSFSFSTSSFDVMQALSAYECHESIKHLINILYKCEYSSQILIKQIS
jgi:hypothetical protein